MVVQWGAVVGYEGIYEVSTDGQVRSLDRVDSRGRFRPGEIKKQWWNGTKTTQYLRVNLYKNGRRASNIPVHCLMLETFVSPRPAGKLGLHADDDRSNNTIENLYWGTRRDNMVDRSRNGWGTQRPWMRKDICIRGHRLTPENRYNGTGDCIPCARLRAHENNPPKKNAQKRGNK